MKHTLLFTSALLALMTILPTRAQEVNLAMIEGVSVSTSWVSSWEILDAVNDGYDEMVDSHTRPPEGWGIYGNWNYDADFGKYNWVEYAWEHTQYISSVAIYWFTDFGGLAQPTDAYIEYFDGENWINAGAIGVELDDWNTKTISQLATKVRVTMKSDYSTGIYEFQVWGIDNAGSDLTLLSNSLSATVATAQALQSNKMHTAAADALSAAINAAQTALAENPLVAANLTTSAANLQAAISAATQSNAAFAALQVAIDSAQTVYGSGSGMDAAVLQAAISVAQTANTNLASTVAETNEAAATLYQAILEYRIANASPTAPVDLSGYIVNPNFNNGNTGWSMTTGATSTGTFTAETKTDLAGGTYGDFVGGVWENWKSTAFSGKMYQTVTGLPNGTYRLSASVYANKTWEEAMGAEVPYQDWLFVYANDSTTPVTDPKLCLTYSVITNVNDGSLELGIISPEVVTNWFAIDNFKLEYIGYDLTIASDYLQQRIDFGTDYTDGDVMQDLVLTALEDAIDDAKEVVATPTKATIESAITRLQAAIAAAESSIAAYATLQTALTNANANSATYSAYSGYSAYSAAVATAQSAYETKALDEDGIADAVEALRLADVACQLTQPAPFDASFVILNPSFEGSSYSSPYDTELTSLTGNYLTPKYWTLEFEGSSAMDAGSEDRLLMTNNPYDGSKFLNIWSAKIVAIDIHQEVWLPAGEYELSAVMRSEWDTSADKDGTALILDPDGKGTQHLYATVGLSDNSSAVYQYNQDLFYADWETAEAWVEMSVEFAVDEDGLVRIGARSNNDGSNQAGWFQLDDFHLRCKVRFDAIPSINITSSDLYAHGAKGAVGLYAVKATTANIYSVTGQLVKSIQVEGAATIALAPGVYIVNKQKIIVK
jgi:hypothetical protein